MNSTAKIERIRKLLAVAKSPTANANEADTAALLAESLMEAAGLSESDVALPDDVDPASTVCAETEDERLPEAAWYGVCATAVARIVNCRCYKEQRRVAGSRRTEYVRVWVGTADQRATCKELYAWVVRQVNLLAAGAQKIARDQAHPRSWMNAYRMGVANGIATKAREMVAYHEQHAPPVGNALVLRDRVQEAIKAALPKSLTKTRAAVGDRAAFEAGRSAGGSVGLRRDVAAPARLALRSGS